MAILSWGKCLIETTTSTDGAPGTSAVWTSIDTPKDGTTQLTTTAGTETEAVEEGGEVVDSRTGKNKYQLEFGLFVKKGVEAPWEDTDGVIAGEHAIRITPEDDTCKGLQLDRCTIRAEHSYTTADGTIIKYICKVLKPKSGKMLKFYTKTANPGG